MSGAANVTAPDRGIAIVPIAVDHVEGFHQALDVVAREHRYLAFLEAPPLDETRAFVEGNIEHGEVQVVAVSDGQVVGWCDIHRNTRPVFAHCGSLGIGILPAFRDQGLGRRLMLAAISQAHAAGLTRIELTVRADNRRAFALYESLGFAVEGTHRKAFLVDGEYYDSIAMALLSALPPT